MNLALTDFAALGSLGVVGTGVLYWSLRGRFASVFVTKAEHDEALGRLRNIEARLELVPSHEDFRSVDTSVKNVELQLATITERVDGLKRGVGRIENTLAMIVDARLQWERDR